MRRFAVIYRAISVAQSEKHLTQLDMHRRRELNEKRLNNVKRPMCIIYLSMTMISEIWPTADCHIVCRMRGGSGVSHEERQGRQLVECSTGRRVTSRFDGLAGFAAVTKFVLDSSCPRTTKGSLAKFAKFCGIIANFRSLIENEIILYTSAGVANLL